MGRHLRPEDRQGRARLTCPCASRPDRLFLGSRLMCSLLSEAFKPTALTGELQEPEPKKRSNAARSSSQQVLHFCSLGADPLPKPCSNAHSSSHPAKKLRSIAGPADGKRSDLACSPCQSIEERPADHDVRLGEKRKTDDGSIREPSQPISDFMVRKALRTALPTPRQ